MILALALGFAFGFFGSIPVAGPISALVVAYGLAHRRLDGLWLSVGAALAEGLYAALAFFGMGTLFERYPQALTVAQALAALILIGVGAALLWAKPPSADQPGLLKASGASAFALGFGLSAANPTLLATWGTAAATLAGLMAFERALALPLALAAFVGIVAWFALLLWALRRLSGRITAQQTQRIYWFFGGALVVVGVLLGGRCLLS